MQMSSAIFGFFFLSAMTVLVFHVMAEVNREVSEHGVDVGTGGHAYGAYKIRRRSWPELVGLKVEKAEEIIQEDLPFEPKFVLVPEGSYVTMDFDISRVRIFVDGSDDTVCMPPPVIG